MVGTLTACVNLVGYSQDGTYGNVLQAVSGKAKVAHNYMAAWTIGGNYHATVGVVKYTPGNADPEWVHSQRTIHALNRCPWETFVCSGIGAANLAGRTTIVTVDTSGDGRISGAADFQAAGGNCGMTDAATVVYGARMSAANAWLDTPTCKNPDPPGLWPSALTDASDTGFGTFMNNNPGSPDSALRRLPFETVQALMNSLESSDVSNVTVGGHEMRVARFQVTSVRIGGDSYKPINTFVNMYDWRATIWDQNDPGYKLMAGWAANKIEALLDRGATSIRMEVELNGSVTLSRDSLPSDMAVTEPSYSTVESWRNFATTNLRHD
jgi:hypothetical protein